MYVYIHTNIFFLTRPAIQLKYGNVQAKKSSCAGKTCVLPQIFYYKMSCSLSGYYVTVFYRYLSKRN